MAVVYRDEKARNRAMAVVLSGIAAGALGKSLHQLVDIPTGRRRSAPS